MTQQKLPSRRPAPSSIAVTAQYDWRSGWSLRFAWRASGDSHFSWHDYSTLSGPELVDVVASELEQLVGPRDEPASGGGAGAA